MTVTAFALGFSFSFRAIKTILFRIRIYVSLIKKPLFDPWGKKGWMYSRQTSHPSDKTCSALNIKTLIKNFTRWKIHLTCFTIPAKD